MITGHIVEYVSRYLNKRGGTRASDYMKFLEAHNFKVINKRFKRCNWNTKFPPLCIIKCHNTPETPYTHVIIYFDGTFHDPCLDVGLSLTTYKLTMGGNLRPTSYMEIEKC